MNDGKEWRKRGNVRFGRDVEEAGRVDGAEAVAEGDEGGALREEHEEAVEAFEEVRVTLGLEELQPEICAHVNRSAEWQEWKENGQVKTGDSINCTSLSIWTRSWTVISRSALA